MRVWIWIEVSMDKESLMLVLDELVIEVIAEAFEHREEVDGFEEVRFTLCIIADKDVGGMMAKEFEG